MSTQCESAIPADQLALELPGLSPLRVVDPAPRRPRRPAGAATPPVAGPTTTLGERVWLVWEDEEVLGVYADPDSAAADCAALRRAVRRSSALVRYECLPVPVFTGPRHQPPGGATSAESAARRQSRLPSG